MLDCGIFQKFASVMTNPKKVESFIYFLKFWSTSLISWYQLLYNTTWFPFDFLWLQTCASGHCQNQGFAALRTPKPHILVIQVKHWILCTSSLPLTSIVTLCGVLDLKTTPKFLADEVKAASSGLWAWYSSWLPVLRSGITVWQIARRRQNSRT